GVGLGTYAHDTAPIQFYNIAQKKMYDTLSKLKRLDSVQVWGRAFKLTKGTLGLYIHKIEKIEN
ncbi:hypothetical protein KA005_20130, partial [bacterium]|nr:hypothetical protein [bacterium]